MPKRADKTTLDTVTEETSKVDITNPFHHFLINAIFISILHYYITLYIEETDKMVPRLFEAPFHC